MNASIRSSDVGGAPCWFSLGGFLGEVVDLRLIMLLAGFGTTIAALWLVASPVPILRDQPIETFEPVGACPN